MSAVDKAPEMPNWEGFGLAIMEDWGAHCDTEASVRFDLAIKFGILRPIAGGFDPDTHVDDHGDAERGDPWFELNRRADLTAPLRLPRSRGCEASSPRATM
ncbi:hypothetical protein QWZ10_08370 [Paracoccus cavernae]|uniref:Uncharacterized protein n=1 Tax=Paracoccus cavernae TaxID=1571207 RepID=A0ABT8D623_9RHOB|nr:hypothetical protein [Paracoccus cavernae]